MKRLAVVVSLLAACQQNPSQLDTAGNPNAATTGAAGALTPADRDALDSIARRLATIESTIKARTGADGKELPSTDRLQRVESTVARYNEALEFLQQQYELMKQQEEQKADQEPDPAATFAVDISKPLAAGQVEGPNTALVTIIEAWDFA